MMCLPEKCQNSVARCGWKPEIHKDVDKMATYLDVKEGSYFDIPLGALQSENIETYTVQAVYDFFR